MQTYSKKLLILGYNFLDRTLNVSLILIRIRQIRIRRAEDAPPPQAALEMPPPPPPEAA